MEKYEYASPKINYRLLPLATGQGRATSYRLMHFTVIVNPHNRPGEGALPNVNYTKAIATLNLLDNVHTIGYVATTWCTKNISFVLNEITVCAKWGLQDPLLVLHGIFFDQTVTQTRPIMSTIYTLFLKQFAVQTV